MRNRLALAVSVLTVVWCLAAVRYPVRSSFADEPPADDSAASPGETPVPDEDTEDKEDTEQEHKAKEHKAHKDKAHKDKIKKHKAKKRRSIEYGGRVFMRDTATRAADGELGADAGWVNDMSVDSARLGVRFDDRELDLRVEIEVELAGRGAELRDGYVRWQPRDYLQLQVGNFKEPISAINLASRWSLPVIERGLLNELKLGNTLTDEPDELPIGGRNVGAMLTWRGRELPTRPALMVAVFRSRVHEQLEGSLVDNLPIGLSDGFPEDVYARLELALTKHVQLGAGVGWLARLQTAGTRDSFEHGLVASVDAVAEFGPVRLWLEGFTGASPIHLGITMVADGSFMAARGIGSLKWRLARGPLAYVEPYVSAQYLDASGDVDDDTAHEYGGGLVLGFAESWRLQAGYDRRSVDNRLLFSNGSRVMVQAGAVF